MEQTIYKKQFEGKFSTEIALASFAIGTLIFATHWLLPKHIEVYVVGLVYVIFAFLVNMLVFLNLLYHFVLMPGQREYLAIKMLILLANVPIAALYVYLTFNSI